MTRLGDLIGITVTRGFPTAKAAESGEVPILSVALLREQFPARNYTDRASVTDLGLELARPNDVLVAIEGGTVGEVFVVGQREDPFVPSQQVATLRVGSDSTIDPWFLGAWLATETGKDQLRRLTRGSGIQRIAVRDLQALIVPDVSLEMQRRIGQRFRALVESIRAHQLVVSCLEELRDADLALAFATLNGPELSDQAELGAIASGRG